MCSRRSRTSAIRDGHSYLAVDSCEAARSIIGKWQQAARAAPFASGVRRTSWCIGGTRRSSRATTRRALVSEVPPRACELLSFCDAWTALDDVQGAGFVPAASFAAVIARMVSLTLLERSDRPADPRSIAMERLRPGTRKWASFTQQRRMSGSRQRRSSPRRARHGVAPQPPAVKRYRGSACRGPATAGWRRSVRTGAAGAPHLAPLLV